MKRVVLYSKPGCHLCELVERIIRSVRRRRTFHLEVRNIELDPVDFENYKNDIPVIVLDGNELARHRLTAAELETALDQRP